MEMGHATLLSSYEPSQELLPWGQGRGAPAWTSKEATTCPACSVARAGAEPLQRSRVGQEPRCSSSSSCFEAAGAGSFPHAGPTVPGSAGPSGYLLSAGESGSLTSHLLLGCRGAGAKKRNREDKGQVSNHPHNPTLVVRAALRLPCCQPGAGPCSSLTNPRPMDQTLLSVSSAGRSDAPNPLVEDNEVPTARQVLPGGSTGRTLCPRVQSCSQPAHPMARTRSALVGLGALSPTMPAHGPHTAVAPNLNPMPPHLSGTSSQTMKRGDPPDPGCIKP